MCYEPLNVENRMCELCTFSQIRSHFISRVHKLMLEFMAKAQNQA